MNTEPLEIQLKKAAIRRLSKKQRRASRIGSWAFFPSCFATMLLLTSCPMTAVGILATATLIMAVTTMIEGKCMERIYELRKKIINLKYSKKS